MSKLSQQEVKLINKICSGDYGKRLQAIQKKQEDTSIKIVNTGMVSSGKSSLYNVLINSAEEYFPTGAARTTIKANYFEANHISYIDTPGIDVRSEDDMLAFNTIIGGDIIMMIHNIRTGPLNRSEVEWLERIISKMNNVEMRKSRLIFVVSWKDTREKEDDYNTLINNLKKQVFEIVETEIPFFEVSVKKYQQGIQKQKDVLVKNSGIQELRNYIETYTVGYLEKKKDINSEEYSMLLQEVKELLISEKISKTKKKEDILKQINDKYKSKKKIWKQVYEYFSEQRTILSSLKRELKELEDLDY